MWHSVLSALVVGVSSNCSKKLTLSVPSFAIIGPYKELLPVGRALPESYKKTNTPLQGLGNVTKTSLALISYIVPQNQIVQVPHAVHGIIALICIESISPGEIFERPFYPPRSWFLSNLCLVCINTNCWARFG